MNDEAAPQGRPDRQLRHRHAEHSGSPGQDVALARVVSLRELVAYGVSYEDGSLSAVVVAEIADGLAELEESLAAPNTVGGGYTCDDCSSTFQWPGLLQRHRDLSGHGLEDIAA